MADKQATLVAALAAGVKDALEKDFKALAEQLAKAIATLHALEGRLAMLESTGGATPAAKRTVRSAGTTATAAKAGTASAVAKPRAGAAKTEDDAKAKVSNTLLFFRHALKTDFEDYREVYGSPENLELAAADPAVAKKNPETQPAEYWSAVGAFLWKSLTDEDKATIRAAFTAWKEDQTRTDADAPLEEGDAE